MSQRASDSPTPPAWLATIGQFQWLRAHISTFAVGVVVLVCVNLIIGGATMWSMTVIGIWGILLLVHFIVMIIARLSMILLLDTDGEEIVLLPVQEAQVRPVSRVDPGATWEQPPAAEPTPGEAEASQSGPRGDDQDVSWEIATSAAHLRGSRRDDPTEGATPDEEKNEDTPS